MRALIVDDEQPARDELAWLLEQVGGVEVVGRAEGAAAARRVVAAGGVEVVFLDIDMPGVGGMRLAELLSERPEGDRPAIIFVTAYQEHAVEAFEVDAVDYLLKPVRLERLRKAVERARERLEGRRDEGEPAEAPATRPLERISIEDRGVYRVVPIEDLLYFEADAGIVVAVTREGRFVTEFSLKFLEQNLPEDVFFRCHRSYIVRLDAIESIAPSGAGTYRLILASEEQESVPLARSRAHELKSRMPWSANVFDD